MLNLQGLRKPAYHAFELLARLGTERVAVSGEQLDSTCNAIVTTSGERAHVLVYASEHDDEPQRQSIEVAVKIPAGSRALQLHRIDSIENNVITRWHELGAPAYLSRQQTKELADDNALKASSTGVTIENGEARFTMESPGLALLELELPRTGA